MKVYTIPISDERSQKVTTTLGQQVVDIVLTMRLGKLYVDVKANRVPVVSGRVCLNGEPIVNEAFRPFEGELYFEDLQGNDDPVFGGLGKRYVLRWVKNA